MNTENLTFEKEIIEISIDDILPNRFQPRLLFDQKSLEELADSIRQHGIIQPLVVRKISDKYEIIAGERRYKASILAGLKKLPCIIMNLNDNESAEVAIVENIQRKEMTPLEEAISYKKLLDRGYLTQEQLAARMGKSQPLIANKLRLLGLDDEVKDALMNEKISERHARSMLTLNTNEEQKEILHQIINNKLTVKQTDDLIKEKYGNNIKEEGEKIEVKSFIPNPYSENEPNPQLNTINRLNTLDTFINPEEQKEETINTERSIEYDFEKMKKDANDININKESHVDIKDLLENKEEQKEEIIMPEEKSKNKFFMDFEDNFNDVEILDVKEELQKTDQNDNEKNNDIKTAITLIKENISTLKLNGFNISFEEFDFEKIYQIIIKIDKEKP